MYKALDLFRYKGVLAVKGTDKKYVFQGVHMIFDGEFDMSHEWKPGETRECRFVFIGRNLDRQELEKGILDCQVQPLRFQVGDLSSPVLRVLHPVAISMRVGGRRRVRTCLLDEQWGYLKDQEPHLYVRREVGPREGSQLGIGERNKQGGASP